MSNADILRDIVDNADSEVEGYEKAIDATQQQIDELQEKQNALKFVLDSTKTDLEAENDIEPIIGVYHTYGSYYNGVLNSIFDNISQWQILKKKTESITHDSTSLIAIGNYEVAEFTGSGIDAMICDMTSMISTEFIHYRVQVDGNPGGGNPDTFKWSDRGGLTWNQTNININGEWQHLSEGAYINFSFLTGYTVGDYWDFWWIPVGAKIYFNTNSTNKYDENTILSVVFDGTNTTHIEIDNDIPTSFTSILEYILEPNGTNWNYDSTTNIRVSLISEFNFANQYIHMPLGINGTYGTKEMLANLGIAKTIQTNNKNNAAQSKTKLARYAT